jgi:hypothetical protein
LMVKIEKRGNSEKTHDQLARLSVAPNSCLPMYELKRGKEVRGLFGCLAFSEHQYDDNNARDDYDD